MPAPRRLAVLSVLAASLLVTASCSKRQPPLKPASPLRLAFATNLLNFDLPVGEEVSRDVRLAGLAATSATLALVSVEGGATAQLLPAEAGQTSGLRISFVAKQPGEGNGRVIVTTGLVQPVAPMQLVLYYSWKVGAGRD